MYTSQSFVELERSCAKRTGKSPEAGTAGSAAEEDVWPWFSTGLSAGDSVAEGSGASTMSHSAEKSANQGDGTGAFLDTATNSSARLTPPSKAALPANIVAQRSRSADIVVGPFPVGLGASTIRATLNDYQSWETFYSLGTEMIITKAGRRIFPCLELRLSGLEDESRYEVRLWMDALGDSRYRFIKGVWERAGKADDIDPPACAYTHPESPNTGQHWMSKPVSFKKAKLTNNKDKGGQHLILNSMHKYRPVFCITKVAAIDGRDLTELEQVHYVFSFDVTDFVAVTAYQNEKVTKLKIGTNPFARAFRNKETEEKPTGAWSAVDGCYDSSMLMGPHYTLQLTPGELCSGANGGTAGLKKPSQSPWATGADSKHVPLPPSIFSWSPLYTFPSVYPQQAASKSDYTITTPTIDVQSSAFPFSPYPFSPALAYPLHPANMEAVTSLGLQQPGEPDAAANGQFEVPPIHSVFQPKHTISHQTMWAPTHSTAPTSEGGHFPDNPMTSNLQGRVEEVPN